MRARPCSGTAGGVPGVLVAHAYRAPAWERNLGGLGIWELVGQAEDDALGARLTHDEPQLLAGLNVLGERGFEWLPSDRDDAPPPTVGIHDPGHDGAPGRDSQLGAEHRLDETNVHGDWIHRSRIMQHRRSLQ